MPTTITTQQWQKSGDWLEIDNLRIFLVKTGTGSPILFLHGFPTSSYDFSRIIQILKKNNTLILFDYPGFGFSDKPNTDIYSLQKFADIAQQILANLNINKIHIVAHDIGNSVALEIIRRKNIEICHLILLNGSLVSTPIKDYRMLLSQKLLLNSAIGPILNNIGIINQRFFSNMFQKIFFSSLTVTELKNFWSLLEFNNGTAIYHRLIQYMRERKKFEEIWLNALASHTAPLTLIWGINDPIAPPTIAAHVQTIRPDTQYFPLQKTGHYPQWEQPQSLIDIVSQRLQYPL